MSNEDDIRFMFILDQARTREFMEGLTKRFQEDKDVLDRMAHKGKESEMNSVTIELQEGEDATAALMRLAKEGKGEEVKKAKKRSQSQKRAPKIEDPMAGAPVDASIWLAQHVYMREGEPEASVRLNARRMLNLAGPGTIVFAHMHPFGGECVDGCKAKLSEEGE